ncbi:hypothetical protein KM043_016982 [Ampulex compressa]|nr:hypothetical protein KM043_016982 [Ampulex compressa]
MEAGAVREAPLIAMHAGGGPLLGSDSRRMASFLGRIDPAIHKSSSGVWRSAWEKARDTRRTEMNAYEALISGHIEVCGNVTGLSWTSAPRRMETWKACVERHRPEMFPPARKSEKPRMEM